MHSKQQLVNMGKQRGKRKKIRKSKKTRKSRVRKKNRSDRSKKKHAPIGYPPLTLNSPLSSKLRI